MFIINRAYGPVMFIGLYLGILFFISACSFLYFRLFSDLDEDKEKFSKIVKMGLTDKELKKVVTRQTAILFFAPIVVALVHGAVALTALAHLFGYDLIRESSVVLGGFLCIQIVYYVIRSEERRVGKECSSWCEWEYVEEKGLSVRLVVLL